MHFPEELKALSGHEVTHFPSAVARRLFAQVRQVVADPAQEPQLESQAETVLDFCQKDST